MDETSSATDQPDEKKAKPRRVKPREARADGSLEKWAPRRVHRSQLRNAEYNPRTIADDARRKLRDNLERVGLVAPVTWNARTGNIVGGHQRIAQMDALMGTDDYHITVAEVDLDEKTEKEQNLFLNNGAAQGDWDFDKLGELFKSGELDTEATGFDPGDIKDLFGGDALTLKDMQELSDAVTGAHKLAEAASSDRDNEQDNNFFSVLVFRDDEAVTAFHKWLGLADDRYVDASRLLRALREKIEDGEPIPQAVLDANSAPQQRAPRS